MSKLSSSFKVVKPSPTKSKTLTYLQFKSLRAKRGIPSPTLDSAKAKSPDLIRPGSVLDLHRRRYLKRRKRRKSSARKLKYPSFSPPADDSSEEEEMSLNISSDDCLTPDCSVDSDPDFEFLPELSDPPVAG